MHDLRVAPVALGKGPSLTSRALLAPILSYAKFVGAGFRISGKSSETAFRDAVGQRSAAPESACRSQRPNPAGSESLR
eukprot:3380799-Pyramimonas_sp.AAC.1